MNPKLVDLKVSGIGNDQDARSAHQLIPSPQPGGPCFMTETPSSGPMIKVDDGSRTNGSIADAYPTTTLCANQSMHQSRGRSTTCSAGGGNAVADRARGAATK